MANLDPFEPDKEDTHSAVFSTCRSLRNITSPSKISFKYLPPKGVQLINPPLSPQAPNMHTNTPSHTLPSSIPPSSPQSTQTLQFRQPSMPSLHTRPQTYSGLGLGHRWLLFLWFLSIIMWYYPSINDKPQPRIIDPRLRAYKIRPSPVHPNHVREEDP